MATALLIVIYFTFISLGLPDSVLGSSWPAISTNVGMDSSTNSILSMIVSLGTIISSFASSFLLKKIKTPHVVALSVLLTVLGLLCFSFARTESTWLFYLACVPLGLGAGAIDSALNNYVALHYKAIHMNWLHCTWGIGASISPLILGAFIDADNNSYGWNWGVITIACIQAAILILLLVTLPLWNKVASKETPEEKKQEEEGAEFKISTLLKSPITYLAMGGFFCYCALENSTGLWLSNYFKYTFGTADDLCATLASIFYIGITVGRFICGPLSLKLKEKTMIRMGEGILVGGILLVTLASALSSAVAVPVLAIVGFIIIGLGCAPIYPAIIRSTPYRFSREGSPKFMGFEMGSAYIGTMIVPFAFGRIAQSLNDSYFALPYLILTLAAIMIVCHEVINAKLKRRDEKLSPEELSHYKTV